MTAGFPESAQAVGPTDVIDCDHHLVARLATDLTAGANDQADAVRRLFTWVRDEIRYDMAPDLGDRADWLASSTVRRGYGFCQQKAVLLAALLRARGIPAGIAVEDLLDYKIPDHYAAFLGGLGIPYHGLTVVHVGGGWQRVDATLDRALCERKSYRLVTYHPGADCVLPERDLAGRPHFAHLAEHGIWADLPDRIVQGTLGLSYLHDPEYKRVARRHGPPV